MVLIWAVARQKFPWKRVYPSIGTAGMTGQVRHHQENTERNCTLREKARELRMERSGNTHSGWRLGSLKYTNSGAGFQDLGGRRLDGASGRSRSGSHAAGSPQFDWHRLLQLCVLSQT